MISISPPPRMPQNFPLKTLDQKFALHALEFIWAGHGEVSSCCLKQTDQGGTAACFAQAYLKTSNLNMEENYTFKEGTLHIQSIDSRTNRVWLNFSEGNRESTLGPYEMYTLHHAH